MFELCIRATISTVIVAMYFQSQPNIGQPLEANISQEGQACYDLRARYIDIYDCPETEVHWNIQRADGQAEIYTVVNNTYHYGRHDEYTERGLEVYGECDYMCRAYLWITPVDQRYNGAQITGIVFLPECYNSPNITESMSLNIQGTYSNSYVV